MCIKNHKFYDRYESIVRTAKTLHDNTEYINNDEQSAHLISESLHYAPPIYTGLMSTKCEGMPAAKMTKEHFFSRKRSARILFDMIKRGKSIARMTAFVMSRARVHRVTKQENIDLRKYQHDTNYTTWQEEYAAAGIELIPYVKKNARMYTYHIDGVEYPDVKTIADKYELSVPGVDYRFRSNSKRFVGWKRVKK